MFGQKVFFLLTVPYADKKKLVGDFFVLRVSQTHSCGEGVSTVRGFLFKFILKVA